jgi:hypothetical protein
MSQPVQDRWGHEATKAKVRHMSIGERKLCMPHPIQMSPCEDRERDSEAIQRESQIGQEHTNPSMSVWCSAVPDFLQLFLSCPRRLATVPLIGH